MCTSSVLVDRLGDSAATQHGETILSGNRILSGPIDATPVQVQFVCVLPKSDYDRWATIVLVTMRLVGDAANAPAFP